MITLYRKNSIGLGVWCVEAVPVDNSHGQVIVRHSSVEGGAMITHVDPVVTNKSGRSIVEQMQLELNARVSRQLDKGYKTTRDEALLGSTNQLGLVNPMLAQKVTDVKLTQRHFDAGAFVQYKYDGYRCLITKQGGELLAYSRKGNPIVTIPHLVEVFEPILQDGDTVDGELYLHGTSLQRIGSLVKRAQPETRSICFRWYDIVVNTPYAARYRLMQDLQANFSHPQVGLVPTWRVQKMAQVYELFKSARVEGYEGAMLRISTGGYEDAKRSAQLLKVKEREDCEVTIVGCRPSAGNWAVLRARMDSGKEFDISAPGSIPEKVEVLENYGAKYHMRRLTIEYANLTDDGIPFHAVAIRWLEEL